MDLFVLHYKFLNTVDRAPKLPEASVQLLIHLNIIRIELVINLHPFIHRLDDLLYPDDILHRGSLTAE